MSHLRPGDVACWLVKTALPPERLDPGWAPGEERVLDRCVRPSYRLDLMAPGQPCVLWLSGRDRPGVHAVGTVAGEVADGPGGPAVPLRLRLLATPLPRAELVEDPHFRDAEVLRMPAGSNPSWLSTRQFAVLSRSSAAGLGP
ncbi:hypothetical protein [Blastococcus saxobsidens]|uniref:EVE domain-containing protein n=1 Tax=Blastococcus saxobsidens TaxID=138336 RepID=A0A4Q7Y5Y9_9ACTN|nr:hypothetical protein [Blastococcus saxobsidens]RZU31521.1 hypothetical protein BKA19_1187 [Blastococcus saxobsidens]